MDTTTNKALSPEDIAKRLAELPEDKRAAELMKVAAEMGMNPQAGGSEPHIELSDEQFTRLFTGMKDEAAKVAKEAAEATERKYNLNPTEAKAAAENEVSRAIQQHSLRQAENQIIGKRFASMLRAQANMPGAHDAYKRALEDEAKHMQRHYGVNETRAMSLSDDTAGGYLAPEVWETRVYESIKKHNLARKYCTLVEMTGTEVKRFPKLTSGLTAYTRTEAQAGTTSQIATSQFSLQPKSLTVLSAPFSLELLEAADPNVIELLTRQAVIAFGIKEDEALWIGSDSQFTGLMENSTNNVNMGGASNSGKTAITQITFDDLFDLENELEEHYTPDEDTENSGGIGGQAYYWFHRNAYNALRKLKGDDSYHMDVETMIRDRKIQGYGFKRVPNLPSAPSTATRFGVFGNLSYVWMGHRPGIRTTLLQEGTVGGVNLATTGQYAMRWIEFVDFALVDDEALSYLKTAAQ